MMFPNHLAGGFAFSGLIGGIAGHNIFQTKTNIICVLVFSILPDIDLPKSPVGRVFKPLSMYINKTWGHRTITHSVFALAIVCTIAAFTGLDPVLCGLAYFSHILFDMVTLMGVPIFAPLSEEVWYLPENEQYRVRTGDTATESKIFAGFILTTVFTQPLMEKGFWTSYNQAFSTQKTLHSEFMKNNDLIEVTYNYEIASQLYARHGYVIEASETKTIIQDTIGKQSFFVLEEKEGLKIKSLDFKHTKRKFFIVPFNFFLINADSLNNIIRHNILTEVEINANKNFRTYEMGIENMQSSLKKLYPSVLNFVNQDTAYTPDKLFIIPSTSIPFKRNEIETVKAEYEIKLKKYNNLQSELTRIINDTTTNYLKREENLKRIETLKREQSPELDVLRIRNLEFEIMILQQNEALQNEIKRYEFEKRERVEMSKISNTLFSGSVKILKIE
jgi:inner membrane protein